MVKNMKFLSLLKNTTNVRSSSSSSWAWPSCRQPKTLSFRASNDVVFKTVNSAYLDTTVEVVESTEPFLTESPKRGSFSTVSEGDPIEKVIRGLRSDRLFFEPDDASSIFEAKGSGTFPFKDSVAMSMDSKDPYVDFRKSMEEMVETLGVKDWEGLEELLCWYLKANVKSNHGFIVGAFVDLLVGLAFSNTSGSSSNSSTSSPLSVYSSSLSPSCSTPCVSCLEQVKEEEIEIQDEASSSSASSSNA